MKITDVRPILLTSSYGVSGAHIARRSACFVQIDTDARITGLGETYAGVYVPEIAARIVDFFRPYLVGRDALNPNDAYRVAYWVSSYFGRTGLTVMVLSAIENALWDVLGKAKGLPVHRLLGGAIHERLPQGRSI